MPARKRRRKRSRGFAERKSPYVAPPARAARAGKRVLPEPMALPDGTVRYFLTVGAKGRVLLPSDLRGALGLEEGDVITAMLKDGEVRMHSYEEGLRRIQEDGRRLAGGRSVVDELIAERRAAAKRGE